MEEYNKHVAERKELGIVPLPLDAARTADLVKMLSDPPEDEKEELLWLLTNRVPPGVDEAAYVKAGYLAAITKGTASSPLISKVHAVELLGSMMGGYNIQPLVDALDDPELSDAAVKAFAKLTLIFDAQNDVHDKSADGNEAAKKVVQAWADAQWFVSKPEVPEKMTVTVFKVVGETNTDDLSPAPDAWSRPDIPLHALAMLKYPREVTFASTPAHVCARLLARGRLLWPTYFLRLEAPHVLCLCRSRSVADTILPLLLRMRASGACEAQRRQARKRAGSKRASGGFILLSSRLSPASVCVAAEQQFPSLNEAEFCGDDMVSACVRVRESSSL
eukprot:3048335-Pleurochrysis_carterae.AAC.1